MINSVRKVALITGGARRLGKEITSELASIGYDVVINYNSTKKLSINEFVKKLERFNIKTFPFKADISKVDEIRRMFSFLKKEFGRIDVLINNAAIFEHVDFLKTNENTFDRFMDTNLKSVFFCSQNASKIMLNQRGNSAIINIASLGAIENWTGYIPYSISKAGVIKLTQLLAKKLAPRIIVNSISPGIIDIKGKKDENVKKEFLKKYPMKRFAFPEDLSSLVRFLVRDNKYITGHNFVIDGGESL